jgi:AraC-type DNA-binding domain-containing proteins
MSLRVEALEGIVASNMMAIVPTHHLHEFETNNNGRFLVLDFHDGEKIFGDMIQNIDLNQPKIFYISRFFNNFFSFVATEMSTEPDSIEDHKTAILAGLNILCPVTQPLQKTRHTDRSINKIMKQIDINAKSIDISSCILKESAMCQTSFYKKFRQISGLSPNQYRIRNILDDAARRLMSSDDRISAISLQSGYENPASFTRIFRKHFGMSPSEYRQKSFDP